MAPSNQSTPGTALARSLGLWQVTISGVGIVIGAGIYVLIGAATAEAGNAVWLAFVVAALMSALTALSYAELASMFPTASAEYEFVRRAFNELLGFMAGWTMLVAYVVAAAAVSLGFGHYLREFADLDVKLSAVLLLALLTLIVLTGVQRSIWLSTALAVMQVGGLVLVVTAGAPHIGERDLLEGASAGGVLSGAALVFFAFIGFDDIVTLSEDTKDPHRTMPRALLLALALSTLLYVLVGVTAVSVVGADVLASSARPLAEVIAHNWGSSAADIVAVIALASTMNTTLLILTAASRIVYGMAARGSLLPQLARVGRKGGAPYFAALAVLAGSASFTLLGSIGLVASVTNLAVYVTFLLTNLAVVALRFRLPHAARGFRIPFAVGAVPITPILALATVILLMAFLDLAAWLIGMGFISLGCLIWFVLRWTRAGKTDIDSVLSN